VQVNSAKGEAAQKKTEMEKNDEVSEKKTEGRHLYESPRRQRPWCQLL